MLSELACSPLLDSGRSIISAFIPIITIVLLEMLLAYSTMKIPIMKKILYGAPSVIIFNGKIDTRELKRQRLELGELITSARENGIIDFSEVRYCILEGDGKLSFFSGDDGDISLPIIIDRRIITKNLKLLSLDRRWLEKKLRGKGLTVRDVFLMTATEKGDIYIIERKRS